MIDTNSAITPINVHYFVRKFKGAMVADQVVQELLDNFKICPIDQTVLQAARFSAIKDYEDAVQHSSAESSGVSVIVTRNLKDYAMATLTVNRVKPRPFRGSGYKRTVLTFGELIVVSNWHDL
ncbi:MAG: type II toxin-antitoxin system VapC family toxin [Desulfuromonadaceae bacterium]